jgi:hypothetical protein
MNQIFRNQIITNNSQNSISQFFYLKLSLRL